MEYKEVYSKKYDLHALLFRMRQLNVLTEAEHKKYYRRINVCDIGRGETARYMTPYEMSTHLNEVADELKPRYDKWREKFMTPERLAAQAERMRLRKEQRKREKW